MERRAKQETATTDIFSHGSLRAASASARLCARPLRAASARDSVRAAAWCVVVARGVRGQVGRPECEVGGARPWWQVGRAGEERSVLPSARSALYVREMAF